MIITNLSLTSLYSNADCSWVINPPLSNTLPVGSTTVITLSQFNLLPNDVLTIYDGISFCSYCLKQFLMVKISGISAQGNVLRTFNSSVTLPAYVVTSGVQAFIQYTSDAALTTAGGFSLSYLSAPYHFLIYMMVKSLIS